MLTNKQQQSVREEEEQDMEDTIEKEEGNDFEKGSGAKIESRFKSRSRKDVGGWKSMPYIIGNETFEKLASMSLIANLVVYLRTQYNLDAISSVTIFTIWTGTCNLSPLLGAYLSDAYIGKFGTLIYGSLTSTLGMIVLAITAAIPEMRPHQCVLEMACEQPKKWQLGVLFSGLGLLVIGAGGIRPCNIAFGVDQFDTTTEEGKRKVRSFYNWYYLSFTLALLVSLTVVVYIQNSVSWAWGLAIPAGFMASSVLVFLLGRRLYVYVQPKGSVFGGLARVVVAAIRKRRLNGMEYKLYESPTEPEFTRMVHTKRFKCLDKAAIVTERDMFDNNGFPVHKWRLCNIDQVEQLKCLISIMPVWVSGLTSFIIMDQQNTFGVQQAMQMDTHLIGKFQVPPGSLGLTSMIALAIYIPIYERVILPLAQKKTKRGIKLQDRMSAGIVMSMLCMLTSGYVEGKRRASALKNTSFIAPMSFAWLLPQFAFSGLTEALMGIGLMEFFNSQLPQSMRTVAGAFVFLNLSVASYLNSSIINIITSSGLKWLGGRDLNKHRLDYYYYMIVGLAVINFIYFITFACHYIACNDSPDANEMALDGASNKEPEEIGATESERKLSEDASPAREVSVNDDDKQ